MAVYSIKKQKKQVVVSESKHLSMSMERGISNKTDCTSESRGSIKNALKVYDLCYDYETGFHYMKR